MIKISCCYTVAYNIVVFLFCQLKKKMYLCKSKENKNIIRNSVNIWKKRTFLSVYRILKTIL